MALLAGRSSELPVVANTGVCKLVYSNPFHTSETSSQVCVVPAISSCRFEAHPTHTGGTGIFFHGPVLGVQYGKRLLASRYHREKSLT